MTIKEHLNKFDIETDNKYDLYNLYESMSFTDAEKKDFHDILDQDEDAEVIYDQLVDRFGDRDFSTLKESLDQLEKIAARFKVNAPSHRGAPMPSPVKAAFNVSAIPDNMRPKYYDVTADGDAIRFEWITQEPFNYSDVEVFIAELERVMMYLAKEVAIKDVFKVIFEIKARDGAEYGFYNSTLYINPDEAILNDEKNTITEAFDEFYMNEYSALDDDIEMLYDRYHEGKESPVDILTGMGYEETEEDIFSKKTSGMFHDYERRINLSTLHDSDYITYAAYIDDEIPEGFTISKTNLYESLSEDVENKYVVIYKNKELDEYDCFAHDSEQEAEVRANRLSKNKSKYSDIRIDVIDTNRYHEFINSSDYFDFMETGEIK